MDKEDLLRAVTRLEEAAKRLEELPSQVEQLKGRVFAHELVAAALVTVAGLGLGVWSLAK